MAWTEATENGQKYQKEVGVTLPASATTAYSSEITFLKRNNNVEKLYATFFVAASAVSGTNVDIALYGAFESGGTKYLLLDGIVADITNAAKTAAGVVDINQYKATYHYVAWTTDANESANNISVYVSY